MPRVTPLRRGRARLGPILVAPQLELFLYASLPQESLCGKVTFRISLDTEGETKTSGKAAAQRETEVSGLRISRADQQTVLGGPISPL